MANKFTRVIRAGVSYFTSLLDVPQSYIGQAGKAVFVKSTEDGLEFSDSPDLSGYVPYTGATSDVDLNAKEINNITYVGDKPTSLGAVTNAVLTRTDAPGSTEALYDNDGNLTFKAYSYKTIGATKYYSVATTSNTLTLPYAEYIFNISFTGATGADGYYLTYEFTDYMSDNMGGDTNPTSYQYGWDIGTNTTFTLNASNLRTRISNPAFTPYLSTPASLDLENDTLNISKLGKQTTNGFVKTTNSDGTIEIDTTTYLDTTTAGTSYLKLDQTTPQTFTGGTVTGTGLLQVVGGVLGKNVMITVSATAPTNPQMGDLWVDLTE
jgi:hypothetical protein